MTTFAKGSLGAAALYYAQELGWPVFPLRPRGKVPLIGKAQGGNGLHDATTSAEQVIAWWEATPAANIGLATGGSARLVVVDVDGAAGEAALDGFGALPDTPISHTGKGRHLVFAADGVRNSAGKLGPQLDVRGEGGYIVAPPSIHPNGHPYRWVRAPWKTQVAELPPAIADAIAAGTAVVGHVGAKPARARQAVDVVLEGVEEGGRNQALTEYVGRQFAMGARELEVLEIARSINQTKFRPPLPEHEVEAVVQSIAAAHARSRGIPGVTRPAAAAPVLPITGDVFDDMAARAQRPIDAVPTFSPSWNHACRGYGGGIGWAPGWNVVVAGGAGVGKSLLALNLTASALRAGRSVGWVSLEMSREQLLLRLLGIVTGRPLRDLEPGPRHSPTQFREAADEFQHRIADAGATLHVAERPARELGVIERLMLECVDAGCRVIVLDYLQCVTLPGGLKMDEQMRQASGAVQRLAYEHEVNTVTLSQFNRSTTAGGERPTIFGLAGSSAIENDADQVLLLDHTSRRDVPDGRTMTAHLDKNRHGPATAIHLRLALDTLRLAEVVAEPEYGATPPPRRGEFPLNDRGHRRDYYEAMQS